MKIWTEEEGMMIGKFVVLCFDENSTVWVKRRVGCCCCLFYCKILYVYLYLSSCIQCYFQGSILFIYFQSNNELFFSVKEFYFVLYKEYVVFLIFYFKVNMFFKFFPLSLNRKIIKKCILFWMYSGVRYDGKNENISNLLNI